MSTTKAPTLKLLCLDLDETLIHVEVSSRMIRTVHSNPSLYNKLHYNFGRDVFNKQQPDMLIFYRPFLLQFIQTLLKLKKNNPSLKIAITTTARRSYAHVVLDMMNTLIKELDCGVGDILWMFDV